MKKRLFTSLAILALVCGGAASCSDDDPVAASAVQAALNALTQPGGPLAGVSSAAAYSGSVAPMPVDVSFNDGLAAVTDEVVSAIAYQFDYNGVAINVILFVSGDSVLYTILDDPFSAGAAVSAKGEPDYTASLDADGTPDGEAVYIDAVSEWSPEDVAGFYENNNTGTNGLNTDVTDGIAILNDYTIACPQIPEKSGKAEAGIIVNTWLFDLSNFNLSLELDEITPEGEDLGSTITLDITGADIPGIAVDVDVNCGI